MDPRRGRRLLFIAFVCSLALHLLAARFFHWPLATPVAPPHYVTLSKRMFLPISKATPRPTPPPVIRARARVHSKIAPPKSSAASVLPGVRTVPILAALPTAAPTPAPTPSLAPSPLPNVNGCLTPNADPAVAVSATAPPIPAEVRGSGKSGISRIQVSLDSHGVVTTATIVSSSGDAGLDQIATAMARASTFTPRLVQCKPTAGFYAYTVKFVAL
ncbi:MAG: TonB family protein [Candidatus Baltobacteraceae bacterium]